MKRVVFVYCEGPHDIAFAVRSLGAHGYSWCTRKVSELPPPLGSTVKLSGIVLNQLYGGDLGARVTRNVSHPPSPVLRNALEGEHGETLLLFYETHGKDDHKPVKRFIENVKLAFDAGAGSWPLEAHAHAFLNDADHDLSKTITTLEDQRLRPTFPSMPSLVHGAWCKVQEVPLACYIFAGADGNSGTLEDSLETVGRDAWPRRWTAAEKFIDIEKSPIILGEYEAQIYEAHKNPSARIKAVFTAAGQLDRPGDPLSMMLHNKMIASAVFERHPQSLALSKFFKEIPW